MVQVSSHCPSAASRLARFLAALVELSTRSLVVTLRLMTLHGILSTEPRLNQKAATTPFILLERKLRLDAGTS